jgi:hypothetical protein
MQKRHQNERKFPSWLDLPDGGRRYWRNVPGRNGWTARYVKLVSPDERTLSFVQEIYDNTGKLVEIHMKYPFDLGHVEIPEEGS